MRLEDKQYTLVDMVGGTFTVPYKVVHDMINLFSNCSLHKYVVEPDKYTYTYNDGDIVVYPSHYQETMPMMRIETKVNADAYNTSTLVKYTYNDGDIVVTADAYNTSTLVWSSNVQLLRHLSTLLDQ